MENNVVTEKKAHCLTEVLSIELSGLDGRCFLVAQSVSTPVLQTL